jgi:hypothetical protein
MLTSAEWGAYFIDPLLSNADDATATETLSLEEPGALFLGHAHSVERSTGEGP